MKRRSFGSKHITHKRAAASLALLLSGCREEQLTSFTAEALAASHNVPLDKAAMMLAAARMART